MQRKLPTLFYRWAPVIAFVILSAQSFAMLASWRGPGIVVAWPLLLILALRWPTTGYVMGGVILRVGFAGACCTDQIVDSQAAWERVISGAGGPWGVGYASTIPPGAPFLYGPLALIWWLPGSIVEMAAALVIMAVLAWQRAYLTLAIFAVWQPSVSLTWVGVNDYSPAMLILVAWLALRWRPQIGAGVLAVAAALKPYAVAWYLPAIGFGGLGVAAVLTVTTVVLWSPVLWWGGPGAYLESQRMHQARIQDLEYPLKLPILRWVAVPLALAGLLVRRWEWAALSGSAVFIAFLFLNTWASHSYWLAVLPVTGVAAESLLRHWIDLPDPWRDTHSRPVTTRNVMS